MRSWPPSLLLLLSVAGGALVVDSILRGSATLSLVVIVPVITGSSPELLVGAGLIFAGFLTWAFVASDRWEEAATIPSDAGPGAGSPPGPGGSIGGGVVLIGPIPIFLGGYRPGTPRARWAWIAVGLALTVGLWLLVAAAVYLR